MLELLGRLLVLSAFMKLLYAMYLRHKQSKRQVICWIENYFKKIDNYIEH